jgi:hypothetical protein
MHPAVRIALQPARPSLNRKTLLIFLFYFFQNVLRCTAMQPGKPIFRRIDSRDYFGDRNFVFRVLANLPYLILDQPFE